MSEAIMSDAVVSNASYLFRSVEVDGVLRDVGVVGGLVRFVGERGDMRAYDIVVDGGRGALLPGLHDHHLHVLALAAATTSVRVGPPDVLNADHLVLALADADRQLPVGSWIRAVGHHESVVPDLDRHWLDRVVPARPVRVQHRSGRQWVLNSVGMTICGLMTGESHGELRVELDAQGRPTGRVTGADAALRQLWANSKDIESSVRNVSWQLASYGVTGITDATPFATANDMAPLVAAARHGVLAQRLTVMGAPALHPSAHDVSPASLGPAKLVVADDELPSIDALVDGILAARSDGRAVAVHCVTRVGLVLTLAAFDEVGAQPGDRIEHGAIIDAGLARHVVEHQLIVVTQPNFVRERGDNYLSDVDAEDRPHLYPCGTLFDAGIGVAGSTDAPFGHPDPWRAMRAAVDRTTASGRPIGPGDRVSPDAALKLFLGSAADPAGRARRVEVGARADLCLLHVPLPEALNALSAEHVRSTWIAGVEVPPDTPAF